MKSDNPSEGDFVEILRRYIQGNGSIDEILGHSKFQGRLWDLIHGYDFRRFNGKCGPEDLGQDVCLKFLGAKHKLRIPGNILTEEEFFDWLFVVVQNRYRSAIRYHLALKRERLRSDEQSEELQLPARNVDPARREFLDEFQRFVGKYPEKHRRAVELKGEGYTFREIAEKLAGEGIPCTYVTVRAWLIAIIKDFKKSLESPTAPPPGEPQKRGRWPFAP